MFNENFMKKAIELSKIAMQNNEVPVGAVVVRKNEIIATAYNHSENKKNALYHAELIAINNAFDKLKTDRLNDCDLYVTLEPCAMCAGAIINSRIKNVYFGAYDKRFGCCGSLINLFEEEFNYRPSYYGGILEDECSQILSEFFKQIRNTK